MKEILERLAIGRDRYGHGVRVDDNTTSWGTKENSWMEMAREEFLDAVIYVVADYIRGHRGPDGGKMSIIETNYMWTPEFDKSEDPAQWLIDNREDDDNGLIKYILENWRVLEPCKHKTLICTLLNILDLDQLPLTVDLSDSELSDDSLDPIPGTFPSFDDLAQELI